MILQFLVLFSSIGDEGTSAFFRKLARKITSAQNSKFYIKEISWKLYAEKFLGNYMMGNFLDLYAGKFLETICWESFWKLYAGNFLMETMCLGNSGVIMAQCYGIILRFQGNGTRGSVEHSGSADLSRTKQSEASKVYRKC